MQQPGAKETLKRNKNIIKDARPNIGKEIRVDVVSDGTGCYGGTPTTADKRANKKAPNRKVGKCRLGPKGISIKPWEAKQ